MPLTDGKVKRLIRVDLEHYLRRAELDLAKAADRGVTYGCLSEHQAELLEAALEAVRHAKRSLRA